MTAEFAICSGIFIENSLFDCKRCCVPCDFRYEQCTHRSFRHNMYVFNACLPSHIIVEVWHHHLSECCVSDVFLHYYFFFCSFFRRSQSINLKIMFAQCLKAGNRSPRCLRIGRFRLIWQSSTQNRGEIQEQNEKRRKKRQKKKKNTWKTLSATHRCENIQINCWSRCLPTRFRPSLSLTLFIWMNWYME